YNGIAYAGEKQVTKSTYDGWQGYKYAKDVEISATEYTKCKDANGGETGDCWAKADPASEKVVPWSTKLGPTADGKSKVELFTKEVTKEQYEATKNGDFNFNQATYKSFPKVDADVVTKEFYDSYTGPGYKKMVDGAYTIEHYFLEYKAIVTPGAVKYYKTVYFIEYYKDAGRLGDNVGGQGFTWNQKVGQPVYVFGYPAAPHPDGDKPFTGVTPKWCYGKTFAAKAAAAFKAEAQIGLKCSMTAGSSGAPWILKYSSTKRLGYINGVSSLIGDADNNGRIDFSTSPYFDSETYSIYKSAANLWSGSIVTKDGDTVTKA
ncbi:trypsin-like serine peptidase, partial [Sphaerisporangium melleum]|uniref:trypsin-like serine peptidase n=2 Tax=Sphaerisporangium melleum TaxID=321316 RepID=UPI0035EC4A07